MFEYYNSLPDYLPADDVKKHFQDLLEAFEKRRVGLCDFIKSMYELSDRQWHTYTLLDPELKFGIDLVISEILETKEWKQADLLICRNTLTIIGNLGLPESYRMLTSFIVHGLDDEKQQDVKKLEDQVEKFSGGKVVDVYSGL